MCAESPLKPGMMVECPAFKGKAEIVEGPNRKGEYRVTLGHLSLWVAPNSLTPCEPEKAKSKKKSPAAGQAEPEKKQDPIRLDLHGNKVPEALEALERAVDRAILDNVSRIEIVHGFGTGAVKRVVDDYLSTCRHVTRFHIDEKNRGTTWAYLE